MINLRKLAELIQAPEHINKTPEEKLALVKNMKGKIGRVRKNIALNHDATFDVETLMDNILSDPSISEDLKRTARVYKKVMSGVLDDIDVGDVVTQTALTLLVSDEKSGYTQTMRDHIEDLAREPNLFENATLDDIINAEMVGSQLMDSIEYEDNAEYHTKNSLGEKIKIFVYLDEIANKDFMIDVFSLERADENSPFVKNESRCGYIHIKQGQQGQYTVLHQLFSNVCKFELVADNKSKFTVKVRKA